MWNTPLIDFCLRDTNVTGRNENYCLFVCHIDTIIKIHPWHSFKYFYILISSEPCFRIFLNYFHCHFSLNSCYVFLYSQTFENLLIILSLISSLTLWWADSIPNMTFVLGNLLRLYDREYGSFHICSLCSRGKKKVHCAITGYNVLCLSTRSNMQVVKFSIYLSPFHC